MIVTESACCSLYLTARVHVGGEHELELAFELGTRATRLASVLLIHSACVLMNHENCLDVQHIRPHFEMLG